MSRWQDNFVGARVYNNANISINDETNTALTFNSERYDTDTIHSTSSNTSRLTCFTAGIYAINGLVYFAADADGIRELKIQLGGGSFIAMDVRPHHGVGGVVRFGITTIYELAVTNYIELVAYHSADNALNVVAAGNYSPEFSMQRIG